MLDEGAWIVATAKYAGFLNHIEHYLGPVRDVPGPTVTKRNRGYALFFCPAAGGELISVVTNGLRFQQVTAVMPQELVCTLDAGQEQIAQMLTMRTADLVIQRGRGLVVDQLVPSKTPLVEDTRIHGVVAMSHPYVGEEFDVLLDANGNVELQIITLIPVLPDEIEFVRQHSMDDLYQRWEEQETELLDAYRAGPATC